MTIIGFVRHGVTDWNQARRIQGQSDIPLNEEGLKQAEAIAQRLERDDWDVIVSSDLSRAYVTAKTIGEALQIEVEVIPKLREMYFGQAEGTTEQERLERWGEHWRELEIGMESDDAIAERGISSITEIAAQYPGKRILVVSHGAFIGRTLKRLIPDVNTEEHLHNTSLTILEWADEKWTCHLYNCKQHLDATSAT